MNHTLEGEINTFHCGEKKGQMEIKEIKKDYSCNGEMYG